MPLLIKIVVAALAESIVSFSGGVLTIVNAEALRRFAHFVVSFAVGALLGVALLELIPEAVDMLGLIDSFPAVWGQENPVGAVMLFVLAGILFFFVLEKFLFWYHCHDGQCPVHTYTYLILWGDFVHNFIDGVIIALAFLADTKLGIATSFAVILHEIPQEISDFSLLMHGGFSRARALRANFIVSLATIAGALLTYMFGSLFTPVLPFALALVAGNFIYLAATDLMPELHEATGFWHSCIQIGLILFGVLLVMMPEFLL